MSVFCHILLSPGYTPGTIALNVTWIEREFNACQMPCSMYPSIFILQPFLRYIELLVENWDIFRTHLCLAPPQEVTPSEFREDLSTQKTRMNGLSCGEEIMTRLSAVLIPCQRVTDGCPDYIYYVLQHRHS